MQDRYAKQDRNANRARFNQLVSESKTKTMIFYQKSVDSKEKFSLNGTTLT